MQYYTGLLRYMTYHSCRWQWPLSASVRWKPPSRNVTQMAVGMLAEVNSLKASRTQACTIYLPASHMSTLQVSADVCCAMLIYSTTFRSRDWPCLHGIPNGCRLSRVCLPRLWPYSVVGGIGSCNLYNSICHMHLCLLERSVGCWCSCVVRCFSDKCSQAYQDQTFVSNSCLNLFQKLLLEWGLAQTLSWHMFPDICREECTVQILWLFSRTMLYLPVMIAEKRELLYSFLSMLCLTDKLCLGGSVLVIMGIIIVISGCAEYADKHLTSQHQPCTACAD